jgi:hypothetical protein
MLGSRTAKQMNYIAQVFSPFCSSSSLSWRVNPQTLCPVLYNFSHTLSSSIPFLNNHPTTPIPSTAEKILKIKKKGKQFFKKKDKKNGRKE